MGRGMSSFGTPIGGSRIGDRAFAGSTFGRNRFVGAGRFGVDGRGFDRFSFGFRDRFLFRNRFGFRGFGFPFFGVGFGWGWGCGDWGWPYWDWNAGCPGYWGVGWGYSGWGPSYGYDNAWVWDNNNTNNSGNYSDYTGDMDNQNYDDSNVPNDDDQAVQVPPQADTNTTTAIDPESKPTVLYMKDGTTFQVTSYWSSGNTLHYLNSQGGVNTINVDQLDIPRTVDENAKQGVRFSVTPEQKPSPDTTPKITTPTVQPASQTVKTA